MSGQAGYSPELVELVDELCTRTAGMERRRDGSLAALSALGLEGIIAKADRRPMEGFVAAIGRAAREGKIEEMPVGQIDSDIGGVDVDEAIFDQLLQRLACGLGKSHPDDEVGIVVVDHSQFTPETRYFPLELGEDDVLTAADDVEDGDVHGAEDSTTA